MKKVKLTLVMFLVALTSAFSAQAKFGFGPKLGVNIDKMNVDGIDWSESNRCGFTGGVTAEYIAPVLGLGFDVSLMYSRLTVARAQEFGTNYDDATNFGTKSSNFFEIPLHIKYKLDIPMVSGLVAPYIYTGPSAAFKLGGSDDYFKTKSTQWGWDLGLGLQLINHLQIGAGYTFGINKLANWTYRNVNEVNVVDNVKVRNNYWTITAAWMF